MQWYMSQSKCAFVQEVCVILCVELKGEFVLFEVGLYEVSVLPAADVGQHAHSLEKQSEYRHGS